MTPENEKIIEWIKTDFHFTVDDIITCKVYTIGKL
jgi:hypothetical protein